MEQTGNNDGGDEAEPELFGTETMAELYARQGRLGEAIRIYAKLLEKNPPADKVARWTERSRSLERARAHVPDLGPAPPLPPAPPAPAAPAPAPRPDEEITQVTAVPPAHTAAAAVPPPPPPPSAVITMEEVHQLPLVITQPVRSGQVVYARRNDLIVLASVNSGGQVVADGNIHIYGALRGRAMAGAQGASDARIFCQKLEAELLAISGVYLIWDDIPPESLGKPAQIALRGESCVIAPL